MIVDVAEVPCPRLTLHAFKENEGVPVFSVKVAVWVSAPEVPVTVTV